MQMKMRNVARQAGVMVELTSIDDPNPKQEKYTSHLGKALPPVLKAIAWRFQRKRDTDWRQQPKVGWCLYRDLDNQWHWREQPPEAMSQALRAWLDAAVKKLPEDVEQVEESVYTISVYWHERQQFTEGAVIDFLKDCANLPLHEPVDPDEETDAI